MVFNSFTLAWIPFQHGIRIGPFAQQHDARNYIVVVDDLPVGEVIARPRGDWPSRILGPCSTTATSLTFTAVPVFVVITVFSMSWTSVTRPTSRTSICCKPDSIKLPPALVLLFESCCSIWPMFSPYAINLLGSTRTWYSRVRSAKTGERRQHWVRTWNAFSTTQSIEGLESSITS